MNYTINPNKLMSSLSKLTDKDRGEYILEACILMMNGKLKTEWAVPIRTAKLSKTYSDQFNSFWILYPARRGKKSGKMPAFKAWQKSAMDEEELLLACTASINKQLRDDDWLKDNGTFIPMAATWLNQRRWEDEIEETIVEEYTDMDGIIRTRSLC